MRKIIIDILKNINPEEVLAQQLPSEQDIFLYLYTDGKYLSNYQYIIVAENYFFLGNDQPNFQVQDHFKSLQINGRKQPKTFEKYLNDLTSILKKGNELETSLDLEQAISTAIEGHRTIASILESIPESCMSGKLKSEYLRKLCLDLELQKTHQKQYMNYANKLKIIELGMHYWRLIREINKVTSRITSEIEEITSSILPPCT